MFLQPGVDGLARPDLAKPIAFAPLILKNSPGPPPQNAAPPVMLEVQQDFRTVVLRDVIGDQHEIATCLGYGATFRADEQNPRPQIRTETTAPLSWLALRRLVGSFLERWPLAACFRMC